MKSFMQGISDEISLDAIEKFANRLSIKFETAYKQTKKKEYEFALMILQEELKKAREELK